MARTIRAQVLDYVEQQGTVRRQDIIKQIRKIQGKPYDPICDRGYYSDSLWASPGGWTAGSLRKPTGHDPRFLEKVSRGLYRIARG